LRPGNQTIRRETLEGGILAIKGALVGRLFEEPEDFRGAGISLR
jgi:hypothetical protein